MPRAREIAPPPTPTRHLDKKGIARGGGGGRDSYVIGSCLDETS
jgi:hypothetical protein